MTDSLLRAGADETVVDDRGFKAADSIGQFVDEGGRLAEDVQRVRELLANAPIDRSCRRRGYLVLCRAHPNRVQDKRVVFSTRTSWRSLSGATSARGRRERA